MSVIALRVGYGMNYEIMGGGPKVIWQWARQMCIYGLVRHSQCIRIDDYCVVESNTTYRMHSTTVFSPP